MNDPLDARSFSKSVPRIPIRSRTRVVGLAGCALALSLWGLWLFTRTGAVAGTLAGQVAWIGTDSVGIAPDAGYTTRLGGLRRVPIAPVLAQQLRFGDHIQAELLPDPDGTSRINKLRFLRRAEPEPDKGAEGALPPGAVLPARSVPGTSGTFLLGAGQGTPTVLAFFFTSCGLPTACPLLTQKLRRLQDEIRGAGRIVTLTLDPEVDTLDALRSYATNYGAAADTWKLGRLDSAELDPLLREVGVARVRSGGQLIHSLHLVLLDRDGRLVWRSEGNSWEVQALAARLRALHPRQDVAP